MFHPTPDIEPLITLSELAMDLPAPGVSWAAYLTGRGIPILLDHFGRSAVSFADALQLFDERREAEARNARQREAVERQAVESDQQRRAQLWGGIPWHQLPPGVSAAEVWAQQEKDARPRRRTLLEDALEGTGGLEYHPLGDGES